MKISQLPNDSYFAPNPEFRRAYTQTYVYGTPQAPFPGLIRAVREGGNVFLCRPGFVPQRAVYPLADIDVFPLDLKNVPFGLRFEMSPLSRLTTSTGWDPEIFVVDGGDNLIPAYAIFPHKREAKCYTAKFQGSTVYPEAVLYEDGFQAEFCTAAHTCHGWGMDAIRSGLEGVLNMARLVNPSAKLTLKNLFRVPKVLLTTATDEQVAFGCMPSRNAYGLEPLVFDDPRQVAYRSAGGHIHFGGGYSFKDSLKTNADKIVQNLDRYAGLPCVALFAGIDDPIRRQFYGRAGEYRLPPHGLEYRVLSNAWLSHPAVAHLVNNLVRGALRTMALAPNPDDISPQEVQEIINHCDVRAARRWVRKNWSLMERLLTLEIGNLKAVEASKNVWLHGIAKTIPDYANVESNWRLNDTWASHTNRSEATWTAFYPNVTAKAA